MRPASSLNSAVIFIISYLTWENLASICQTSEFHPWHGRRHPGNVSLDIFDEYSVPVSKCRRLCRQYLSCTGFNVRWESSSRYAGTCSVLDASGYQLTVADGNYSFYSLCPPGMSYYHEFRSCYGYKEIPLTWDEARNYCSSAYSGSHLIDVNSPAEQEILQRIAVSDPGPLTDCTKAPRGKDYRGNRTTTMSGLTCQRWDSQSPYGHIRNDVGIFPDAVNNKDNYCRNPDEEATPWCYTTSLIVRWEMCAIPECADGGNTWLGGRGATGGSFTWVHSGDSVNDGFQNWYTQPADSTRQCMAAFNLTTDYGWFAAPCTATIPFICELEIRV